MAERPEQDIEFLPSDELVEPEPVDPEDAAVHRREAEGPAELLAVEAEELDADELPPDEADELEVAADEAAGTDAGAEPEAVAWEVEEHEEDLDEILRRHYGIESAEPEAEPSGGPTGAEFVCSSCFLRKPVRQLADPERGICVDCAATGG